MRRRNKKPHSANCKGPLGNSAYLKSVAQLYGNTRSAHIPDNWRDRLPDPAGYYGQHVEGCTSPTPTAGRRVAVRSMRTATPVHRPTCTPAVSGATAAMPKATWWLSPAHHRLELQGSGTRSDRMEVRQ